jgi:hypothetical protein
MSQTLFREVLEEGNLPGTVWKDPRRQSAPFVRIPALPV